MDRVMGLDVGLKRIGVALSDLMGWTAQGHDTIHLKSSAAEESFPAIKKMIEDNEVATVVVGLPKNMNGSIGPRGEQCQEFAASLETYIGIPVVLYDERLTTQAAQKTLIQADVSRKKRKQVVDKMAAVLILQGYLDRNQNSLQ